MEDNTKVQVAQATKEAKDLKSIAMVGNKDRVQEENDKLTEIMGRMRDTQIYQEVDPMRMSHISLSSKLNESQLVNAVAEVLLGEISNQSQQAPQ